MQISEEEKQKILDGRELKGEPYDTVLAAVTELMEQNPYCRKILDDANYRKPRPHPFDPFGFYLEKIYIAESYVYGHCTKEKFDSREDDWAPENGTRDIALISSHVVDKIISLVTGKTSDEIGGIELSKAQAELAAQMVLNEVAHECSHGNQMQKRKWAAQETRAVGQQTENEQCEIYLAHYIDVYAKADLSDERAKGDPVTYDVGQLKKKNDETRKKAKKFFEKEKLSFAYMKTAIEKKKDEYRETILNGGYVSQGRKLTKEETVEAYTVDAIDEAGVMADSWVALLSIRPHEKAVAFASELYRSRMHPDSVDKMLKSQTEAEYQAMFAQDENGNYTPDAIKRQQKKGREIFAGILAHMSYASLEAKLEHAVPPDYNSYDAVLSLAASYQKRTFGTADEYIATVADAYRERKKLTGREESPQPLLKPEYKQMLKFLIESPEMLRLVQEDDKGGKAAFANGINLIRKNISNSNMRQILNKGLQK